MKDIKIALLELAAEFADKCVKAAEEAEHMNDAKPEPTVTDRETEIKIITETNELTGLVNIKVVKNGTIIFIESSGLVGCYQFPGTTRAIDRILSGAIYKAARQDLKETK